MSDETKSPVEQAIDQALNLFFYAPIGLVLGAEEVIPQLIERGKQQVAAARMFGKFAVDKGAAEAAKAASRVQEGAATALEQLGRRTDGRSPAPRPGAASTAPSAPASTAPSAPPRASAGPGATALAIPDYDSLSASQVVPRLAGLSDEELEAVRAYESGHRGRKTILHRVAQLQG